MIYVYNMNLTFYRSTFTFNSTRNYINFPSDFHVTKTNETRTLSERPPSRRKDSPIPGEVGFSHRGIFWFLFWVWIFITCCISSDIIEKEIWSNETHGEEYSWEMTYFSKFVNANGKFPVNETTRQINFSPLN